MQATLERMAFLPVRLTHTDVLDIGREILRKSPGKVVVLDLRKTQETTTAALAGLIILRKRQIRAGGDLLLLGLTGKAQYLYEILRLTKILPRRPCVSPRRGLRRGKGNIKLVPRHRVEEQEKVAG